MVTPNFNLYFWRVPRAFALAVLALAIAHSASAPAHAALPGLSCKPGVVKGVGAHGQKTYAHKLALIDWVQKVTASFGSNYASWSKSRHRSVSCSYHPVPGQLRWRCSVYGQPCRIQNLSPHQYRPPPPAQPGYRPGRRP